MTAVSVAARCLRYGADQPASPGFEVVRLVAETACAIVAGVTAGPVAEPPQVPRG